MQLASSAVRLNTSASPRTKAGPSFPCTAAVICEGKWLLGKSPAAVLVGILSLGHRDFTKWEYLVHRAVHF